MRMRTLSRGRSGPWFFLYFNFQTVTMRKYLPLIGLLVLAHAGCKHDADKKHEDPTFQVTNPVRKDTMFLHEFVCQIKAIRHIELRAIERGYLQQVLVDEGQFVKKGQLMFQIMPLIYQAEFQKARAEVDYARIEYENTRSLAESDIVSRNELALAKARLDKAQAELELARVHLGFTEIRAPFDGIVGRFNEIRMGSLLDEGELLTTLSDNSKMWVYFNVPESEYLDHMSDNSLNGRKRVMLKLANGERFGEQGVVETIEADFNNATGNIAFRATFANPSRLLRHGQTGNILMPVHMKDALLIPQKATYEVLDKKFVYVVDGEGKVRARQIATGTELPHLFTVTDGLAESDTVLLEGLRKVRDGQKIRPDFKPMVAVLEELAGLYAE